MGEFMSTYISILVWNKTLSLGPRDRLNISEATQCLIERMVGIPSIMYHANTTVYLLFLAQIHQLDGSCRLSWTLHFCLL
jgi:hypothetical protein